MTMATRAVSGFRTKRIYDPPGPEDGRRVLVDRVWPRGIARADANLDEWVRDAAPSTGLRRWFAHDRARWETFVRRYHAELEARPETVADLLEAGRHETVTLCFGARDREYNNAVALKAYLDRRL